MCCWMMCSGWVRFYISYMRIRRALVWRRIFLQGMNEFGSMSTSTNSSKIWSYERKVGYGVRCTSLLLKSQACSDHGFDSHCLFPRTSFAIFDYQWWGHEFCRGFLGNRVHGVYAEFLWQSQAWSWGRSGPRQKLMYGFDSAARFTVISPLPLFVTALPSIILGNHSMTTRSTLVKESSWNRVA